MAQIKINATYGLTGTLPAVSGVNLTALNGTQVTSGTVADARISALTSSKLTGNLPALNASSLTNLDARDLENALPAISAASLTGIVSSQMPSGNIIQIATAFNGDYLNLNTTSYVDVGLSLSFTPKRSSSTLIIQGIMYHRAHATSTVYGDVRFKMLIDSTIAVEEGESYSPLGERWVVFQPMMGIYSNSNTNAKTIKMQVKNVATGSVCVVNPYTGQSSLLVLEVV